MSTGDPQFSVQRRDLLKGAAALAGAAAVPAKGADSKQARPDYETDIICVGGGAAALSAAVTAAAGGARVIVVERLPVLGGTTAKSGGVMWIPNNFMMRQKGTVDDKNVCLRYMARYSDPIAFNPEAPLFGLDESAYRLLEAYYDNATTMVDHLRSVGALRLTSSNSHGTYVPDYLSHVEDPKVSTGRPLAPVLADGSVGQGSDLIAQLEAWLSEHGVKILTDHRVTELLMNGGSVVGVQANVDEKTMRIAARKAVIFGSGGYVHNVELVRRHQAVFIYGSCAQAGSTGDFISLAGRIGAQMGNLANAWRVPVFLEQAVQNRQIGFPPFILTGDSMIVVNSKGRRVVNEKRNYHDRSSVQLALDPNYADYPNHLLFLIYDQRTADLFAGSQPYPQNPNQSYIIRGGDWAELGRNLAARLGKLASHTGGARLAPEFVETLRGTVQLFNGFARAGRDDDFQRGAFDYDRAQERAYGVKLSGRGWPTDEAKPNNTMYPFQPKGPYYAIIMAPGALDTNGGPVINEKAQVVGYDNRPIPRLYGAGNCIAAPTRRAYCGGGGTIGPAMTFGYIAAQQALRESATS